VKVVPSWVNLPNLITLLRLAAVPFAVNAILAMRHDVALAIVLAAGLTDTIDGALARRLGTATEAGAYLDPIVDKIFLSAVYITLAQIGAVTWWLVIGIFARDFLILAICGAALLFTKVRRFPPSVWGKASTFLQILCALFIMIGDVRPDWTAAHALIWPTAILTAVSGLHYLLRAARILAGPAASSRPA
jgi:cardiolipin synthase